MKLRIKEIAKKAGVSVATISRAINPENRKKVAPKTLKKIDRLVREYAYTPNFAAKILRKVSTKTIGVIFPSFKGIFSNSYYTNMLSGVSDFMLESDYRFKILLLKEGAENWEQYDFKSAESVDGLIVTHWPQFFSKNKISELNIPCVFINDLAKNIKAYFVCGDHFSGGKKAARHLFSLGHRRMAVFTGLDWSSDSHLRLAGFRSFLQQEGILLNPSAVVKADYQEHIAYNKVEYLLKNNPKITAIFCCNDEMAFGVIKRLKELGIKCPADISVVGYDDILRASAFIPALTTLRDLVYDLARAGAKSLISYLEKRDFANPLTGQTLLPVELIERRSTSEINKRK